MLSLLAVIALQAPQSQIPSSANFKEWISFIRPSEQEDRWRKIGWRNSFTAAIQESKDLGRPILLWTMNGDPLGCT